MKLIWLDIAHYKILSTDIIIRQLAMMSSSRSPLVLPTTSFTMSSYPSSTIISTGSNQNGDSSPRDLHLDLLSIPVTSVSICTVIIIFIICYMKRKKAHKKQMKLIQSSSLVETSSRQDPLPVQVPEQLKLYCFVHTITILILAVFQLP